MSELVNYSTGVTVPAAWLNHAQLREEGLASYVVYQAGGTTYAKALFPGGTDYSATSLAGVNPIQQAINSLTGGGKILIRAGTYDFGIGQPKPAGFPNLNNAGSGVGLILPGNVQVEGEGRQTILTTTTTVPGSPTVNDYFAMFCNKNHASSDGFIAIRNLAIVLPAPSQTGNNMQAWDDSVITYGTHDLIIENVYSLYGGYILYPDSVHINTANALTLGSNYNNKITHCMSENQTINTGFFQGTDSEFSFNIINKAWDDPFIIASAGQGHRVIGNRIDANEVVAGGGAFLGGINLQNDGAVGVGASSGVLRDNIIIGNVVKNALGHSVGGRNCFAALRAQNTTVKGNIFHDSIGSGALFENCNGIDLEGNTIFNCAGSAGGVRVVASETGTYYDTKIINNLLYNNGAVAQGSSGIQLAAQNAGMNFQDMTIQGNIMYDDLGTHVQTNAIRFASDGNMSNVLIAYNNGIRSTAFLQTGGVGVWTARFKDNLGYNPVGLLATPYDNTNNLVGPIVGNSATLTSAKTYTCRTTPLDLYLGGGTVTAMTKNGQTIGSGTSILPATTAATTLVHLEPGDTWSITFSVTPTTQLVFGL